MSKIKYRKFLIIILMLTFIFSGVYYVKYLKDNIPDNIYVEPYKKDKINLNIPFVGTIDIYEDDDEVVAASVNMMKNISLNGTHEDVYSANVKLFGIFNIKTVNLYVEKQKEIIAYGMPIGIHLDTAGVLIVDTGNVNTINGEVESPSRGILKAGDYILSINGNPINNKTEMIEYIQQSGDIISLEINRNGIIQTVKIKSVIDEEGVNKLGIWVRDDCQGLGTLTYVDRNNNFGALGHAICEENTGNVVNFSDGYIYTAKIWSIVKGKKGHPGEIVGSINYGDNSQIGKIEKNCKNGIYGHVNESILAYVDNVYLKAAYKQEVKEGKAYIRSFVSGEINDYEINIYNISYSEKEKNKGIVFEITDEELLNITNGVVQGMSGSPLIQNGKLIGAVTHVLVNDPTRGYGIFIENMLETANQVAEEQAKKDAS